MDGVADQLLQTKLQRPRIPRGLVLRPRLFERLNQGTRGPLTLVCAGAGYGKTTLVSSWIESRPAENGSLDSDHVAWISLDEMDRDLHRFLRYLVVGLRTMFPGACAHTLELVQAREDLPPEQLVGTFSNEVAQFPQDFVLVLDDQQAIGEETTSDFFSRLIRHWPAPMHVVLISRRDPALPLPKLRAKGLLAEIRAHDLKFAPEEASAYVSQALHMPIDQPTIDQLERQIEGWIAGLQLATLSLRFAANPEAALVDLTGTEADFAEYLVDEVLVRQPAPIRAFLLQTAFLEHFCASLCDAVTSIYEPEWDAKRCIDWLEHANLFLISLDSRKEWYRYHHIFRSVLQSQAMAELGPERVGDLQRHAAAWLDEVGLTDEALRQAVAAHDLDLTSRLIEHGLCGVLNREDRPTLDRWLDLLPEEMIQARPGLLIMKAWSLHWSWQALDKVLARLALLLEEDNGATLSADARRIVRGQMLELYGKQAYDANQFATSIAYCREALTLLPETWSYARSGTTVYLGFAMQASGQDREAEQLLVEDYQALGNKTGTYGLRLLAGLCLMYNNRVEDLEQTRMTAQRLLDGAEVSGLGVMRGWGRYFLGIVHYQRNELAAAKEHFAKLVEYRYTAHLGVLCDGAQHLASIHLSMGEAVEAWQVVHLLDQIDLDYFGRESALTSSVRARLRLMAGDLEGAARWADAFREPVPDRAQLFAHPAHLTKARILIARGTPADLQAALDILAKIYDIAGRSHNSRLKMEVLAVRSIALRAQGKTDQWQEALQTAVNLARPGGWLRPFVDLGSAMSDALRELAGQAGGRGDVSAHSSETLGRILAAFSDGDAHTAAGAAETRPGPRVPLVLPALPESLTTREAEILSLLAGPLSLKEIAGDLGISLSTVKSHTLNIYAKLGVSKRRDAVARAQALGNPSSH